jgi:hypothetical protein
VVRRFVPKGNSEYQPPKVSVPLCANPSGRMVDRSRFGRSLKDSRNMRFREVLGTLEMRYELLFVQVQVQAGTGTVNQSLSPAVRESQSPRVPESQSPRPQFASMECVWIVSAEETHPRHRLWDRWIDGSSYSGMVGTGTYWKCRFGSSWYWKFDKANEQTRPSVQSHPLTRFIE